MLFGLLVCLFLSGCQPYKAGVLIPQEIRKIAVANFEDESNQENLAKEVTRGVVRRLLQDQRVQVAAPDEARGLLLGVIRRYYQVPLQTDEQQVPVEYKLVLLVDVEFRDLEHNSLFWTTYPGKVPGWMPFQQSPLFTEERAQLMEFEDHLNDLSQGTPFTRVHEPLKNSMTAQSRYPTEPHAYPGHRPTPPSNTSTQARVLDPPAAFIQPAPGTRVDSANPGTLEESTTYALANRLGKPAENEEMARLRLIDQMAAHVVRRVMEGDNRESVQEP